MSTSVLIRAISSSATTSKPSLPEAPTHTPTRGGVAYKNPRRDRTLTPPRKQDQYTLSRRPLE